MRDKIRLEKSRQRLNPVGEGAAARNARISPTPDNFEVFSGKVFEMWGSQPAFTEEQLASITIPFLIAAGVYEEAIDESHTKHRAELIAGAQVLLIDNASHFALWQHPRPSTRRFSRFSARSESSQVAFGRPRCASRRGCLDQRQKAGRATVPRGRSARPLGAMPGCAEISMNPHSV